MKILLIEDDLVTSRLLQRVLEKRGHRVSAYADAEGGWAALQREWFPAAFLDLNLPGNSGLDLTRQIRLLPEGNHCYIVIATAESGPDVLDRILAAGADDYIAKPFQPGQLNVRLAVSEKRAAEIQSLREAQKELTFLARHDPLTRLWNRRELSPAIERTAEASDVLEGSCLMIVDLDHFKAINDYSGHQAGDRILVDTADAMRETLPQSATNIRYGGDEFVAVLPGVPAADAVPLAELLVTRINALAASPDPDAIRPGASIGIAKITQGVLPEEVIRHADAACYRAKSQGKNRAEVFVEFDANLLRSRKRKQALPKSENKGEKSLRLHFQPVCDLLTGRIVFQEALLRFLGPAGDDPIQAAMFLSQITDRAYVRSLDQFVVEEITQYLLEFPDLTASINVSASSLADWHFCENLDHLLSSTGLPGDRLILEITETQEIADFKMAHAVARRIRSLGVRIALDDFGTGFSSLTSLKNLPADLVKLDGDLTRSVEEESFNQVMVDAVTVMSRGIGFATVAERIERHSELNFAREHGINYGQGYLIGKPRKAPWTQGEIPADLFAGSPAKG